MWWMQFSRARFLSSECRINQGAHFESVALSIISRAREYSNHLLREGRSIGLNFHCRKGSSMRASKRRFCSLSLTSSQILISLIPPLTMYRSTSGHNSRNLRCCSLEQNPITRSTPARLYQLRSKITISPAAGKCCMYLCMYIIDFSRSDGAGRAITRKIRGLTRSVIARIVPPLPAASRPSKMTITRSPLYFTQYWSLHNSACNRTRVFSYCLRFKDLSPLFFLFSIAVGSIEDRMSGYGITRAFIACSDRDNYGSDNAGLACPLRLNGFRGQGRLVVAILHGTHPKARDAIARLDVLLWNRNAVSVSQRGEVRRADLHPGLVELILDVLMQI